MSRRLLSVRGNRPKPLGFPGVVPIEENDVIPGCAGIRIRSPIERNADKKSKPSKRERTERTNRGTN
jgi:hypothetical protein